MTKDRAGNNCPVPVVRSTLRASSSQKVPETYFLSGISKAFFGISVLNDVSLQLEAGKTLGLVGENGAGKSTLMNILGGNLRADAGEMTINGQPYAPQSPRDAAAAGIAFIHQELNLFANLSIAENLFLTRFPGKFGRIDRRAMHAQANELLQQVGLKLAAHLRVENLSSGERQLVEIAKALNLNAKLIILDEPTTSLTFCEVEKLFELLHVLRGRGIAMIYISHALGDVQRLCDEVLVLRDGRVVGNGPIQDFPPSRLVSLMVGREMNQQFPPRASQPAGTVVLAAKNISQRGVVKKISFELCAGEVLGIAGLMGSGRTELARILFGLDRMEAGSVELDGQRITHLATRDRIRRGLAMLTESRRDDGLCMSASIHENLGMVAAPKYARLGMVQPHRLADGIQKISNSVQLSSTADHSKPVRTLSGGNQQKVVLAKWLLSTPRVLILDEPTRGIDVGAKFEIYRLIAELAASGSAMLVISSEIEELLGICHRILVMSEGEFRDELVASEFDRERILRAALRTDVNSGASR